MSDFEIPDDSLLASTLMPSDMTPFLQGFQPADTSLEESLDISQGKSRRQSDSNKKETAVKPKTIEQSVAMTIAQLQKIDDGARPEQDFKLLPQIQDFELDSESILEVQLDTGKLGNLYLGVEQDNKYVLAKFDNAKEKLIISVREKYRCKGFEGVAHVKVKASTGIKRQEDDFSKIIKQNRYDIAQFTVTFKQMEEHKYCKRDLDLELSPHLSFEKGRLYVREGKRKFQTEIIFEIGKLLYVKDGVSMIYPSARNSKFDITKQI
jgi:hypothetical protein